MYLDLLDGGELVGGDVVDLDQDVPRAGGMHVPQAAAEPYLYFTGHGTGTSSIASGFAAFPAAVETNGASTVATHVAATASLLMSIAVFPFLFCQASRSCSIYANAVDSHRRASGSLLALGGHDAQAHSMRAVGEIVGQHVYVRIV